jgi:pseudouridine-5'-phosphate glycosidase
VVGYQTDEFPAFYSLSSGLPVNQRAQTPAEIAEIARAHWSIGLESAVLVGNPPPVEEAIPAQEMEAVIAQALAEANQQGVRGAAMTPFLLARVGQLSHGASLQTNLALLRNNARLAAQIAVALAVPRNIRAV